MARGARSALLGAAAVVVLGATMLAMRVPSQPAGATAMPGPATVAGSDSCRECHAEEFDSWHATYHRTMTQEATGAAVVAPFAGETLEVLGHRVTMDRTGDGVPRVTVERDGELVMRAEVEFTVGSHRYQQYVARIDRGGGPLERWRLPVAWHIGEARWIHLGGAFLFPDGRPDDFMRHLSRWNDNCVFCHNTQPVPGLADGVFETSVGEVGIACEACHGPASQHVVNMQDPQLRARAEAEEVELAVAHPSRLTPQRHAEVCGRCHGNRIGHDLAGILAKGDGFVPGQPLSDVSRPIFADSQLHGERPFANRFWPDGTPRLSAYEYQALLLSPCYDGGAGLTCGDCHTMHGDEPSMQLLPTWSPTATCGGCHQVAADHGGHAAAVSCVDCHMPRVTYGLLEGMMSHRVTTPDPKALLGRTDQPDACTQCHVDRARDWANSPSDGSRVELDLLGGDPVQRALAAHALARPGAVGDVERRKGALALALEDDYPAVRWFAWRGYRALAPRDAAIAAFDFMADPAARLEVIGKLDVHEHPLRAKLPALEAGRDDKAIEIGE